jgi:hypothetical protein
VVGLGFIHGGQPVLETSFPTDFQGLDIRDGDLGVTMPGSQAKRRAVGWVLQSEQLFGPTPRPLRKGCSASGSPEGLKSGRRIGVPTGRSRVVFLSWEDCCRSECPSGAYTENAGEINHPAFERYFMPVAVFHVLADASVLG